MIYQVYIKSHCEAPDFEAEIEAKDEEELKQIEEELQGGNLFGGRLSEMLITLSGYYSAISGGLERIELVKGQEWLAIRQNVKTDRQAEREWEMTNPLYAIYKLRLKKIEKMMSAIKKRIDHLSEERRYSQHI